jgi:hypothetical protein
VIKGHTITIQEIAGIVHSSAPLHLFSEQDLEIKGFARAIQMICRKSAHPPLSLNTI